jgi:hypothetical protein
VTPQGSSVTLTAVTAGTADIVASVGTQDYQFTLQVLPPGSASKTWVGGAAAGATAWSEATNWSPTGAPTASDDVLIPATANGPLLSAAAQVNDLTVQSGAELDLGDFSIQVSGDLQAPGAIVFGTVALGAGGTTLSGNLDGLFVSQPRSATGTVTLGGDLETTAAFDVGAQTVSVGGNLTVLTGGRLVMTSAGGVVSVAGDAIFAGDSEDGSLTAGLLLVSGDFTAGGSTPTSFAASGTHRVGLGGTAPQTISFSDPGPTTQRFNDLYLDNNGGVDLAGDAHVTNNVFVSSALTVAGGQVFDVGGVLTLESGSTLTVEGAVTATGGCVNQGATIIGAGEHPCGPGPAATRTWVGGASPDPSLWSNANNWNPAGVPGVNDTVLISSSLYNPVLSGDASVAAITVSGNNIVILAGYTLSVSGDVDALDNTFTSGTVEVTGAGNVLQGYFDNLRVSAPRSLTNQVYTTGNLELLDALDTNGQTAWITGNLTVDGAGKLVMNDGAAQFDVYGDATFNGADHTGALTAGLLSVWGNLVATDASPTSFVSSGTHELALNGVEQVVTFQVPAQQLVNALTVNTISRVTFSTDARVTGDLSTIGYLVVPTGTTLTIDGTLDLSYGSVLEVEGTVVAGACIGDEAWVFGSGTPPCGTPVTVDRVWLGGDALAPQDWGTASNWSPVGVPQPTEVVLLPYRTYQPVLSANRAVAGLLVHYSAYLDLGSWTLSVAGDVNVRGYVDNGLIQVTDVGTVLEGYLDNLRLDAPRSLSGFLTLNGNADVQAKLTIGPEYLYVFGDLDVTGVAGELVLDDVSSAVLVQGTATLDGLKADLLDGNLYLYGDLVANAAMSTGAAVLLAGDTPQTVTLGNPGTLPDQQHFAELYVGSTAGVVTFASDVYVTGAFSVSSNTITRTGNAILEVQGTFVSYFSTFSGIPVRIDTPFSPGSHALSNMTFTGYAATDTQLYIQMPGSVTPLTLTNPVFNTVPESGSGYYIDAANTTVGNNLIITLVNPNPTGVTQPLYKIGTNTIVNWP